MDESGVGEKGRAERATSGTSGSEGPGRRRVPAAVADQSVAAATNLLLMVVAARSLDAAQFGVLGVLYAVYLIVLGCSRSVAAEPTLVRGHPEGWREDATGAALAIALLATAAITTFAIVAGGSMRAPSLALAAVLPALVVQDAGRYLGFAARHPIRSLRLDLVWGCALLAMVAVADFNSVTSLLVAWGGAGALSAAAFLWLDLGRIPGPSFRWVRASWRFSWRYLVTFATAAGVTYLTILLLGVVDGIEAVGTIRATQVMFGPLNIVYSGVLVTLVPDGHGDTWSTPAYQRRLVQISMGLAVVAAAVTAVILGLPDAIGEAILGDTWSSARTIVVPVGVGAMLASVLAGAEIGMRAARAVSESLKLQLSLAPLHLLLPLAGAAIAGVEGFVYGAALAIGIGALTWWLALSHHVKTTGAAGTAGAAGLIR